MIYSLTAPQFSASSNGVFNYAGSWSIRDTNGNVLVYSGNPQGVSVFVTPTSASIELGTWSPTSVAVTVNDPNNLLYAGLIVALYFAGSGNDPGYATYQGTLPGGSFSSSSSGSPVSSSSGVSSSSSSGAPSGPLAPGMYWTPSYGPNESNITLPALLPLMSTAYLNDNSLHDTITGVTAIVYGNTSFADPIAVAAILPTAIVVAFVEITFKLPNIPGEYQPLFGQLQFNAGTNNSVLPNAPSWYGQSNIAYTGAYQTITVPTTAGSGATGPFNCWLAFMSMEGWAHGDTGIIISDFRLLDAQGNTLNPPLQLSSSSAYPQPRQCVRLTQPQPSTLEALNSIGTGLVLSTDISLDYFNHWRPFLPSSGPDTVTFNIVHNGSVVQQYSIQCTIWASNAAWIFLSNDGAKQFLVGGTNGLFWQAVYAMINARNVWNGVAPLQACAAAIGYDATNLLSNQLRPQTNIQNGVTIWTPSSSMSG